EEGRRRGAGRAPHRVGAESRALRDRELRLRVHLGGAPRFRRCRRAPSGDHGRGEGDRREADDDRGEDQRGSGRPRRVSREDIPAAKRREDALFEERPDPAFPGGDEARASETVRDPKKSRPCWMFPKRPDSKRPGGDESESYLRSSGTQKTGRVGVLQDFQSGRTRKLPEGDGKRELLRSSGTQKTGRVGELQD